MEDKAIENPSFLAEIVNSGVLITPYYNGDSIMGYRRCLIEMSQCSILSTQHREASCFAEAFICCFAGLRESDREIILTMLKRYQYF